jgi:hypothetical protein
MASTGERELAGSGLPICQTYFNFSIIAVARVLATVGGWKVPFPSMLLKLNLHHFCLHYCREVLAQTWGT